MKEENPRLNLRRKKLKATSLLIKQNKKEEISTMRALSTISRSKVLIERPSDF